MLGPRNSRSVKTFPMHREAARPKPTLLLGSSQRAGARRPGQEASNSMMVKAVRPYQQRTHLRSGQLLSKPRHSRRVATKSRMVEPMQAMYSMAGLAAEMLAKREWQARALLPRYRSRGIPTCPGSQLVTSSRQAAQTRLPCTLFIRLDNMRSSL